MQQVMIDINNAQLEQSLLEEAKKRGLRLSAMILEILEKHLLPKKEQNLRYETLDPLKNMSPILYEPNPEIDGDLSDVSLFEDVKDSAAYIHELRKNAWRR